MDDERVDDLVIGAMDDLRLALAALIVARECVARSGCAWSLVAHSLRLAARHVASCAAKLETITN